MKSTIKRNMHLSWNQAHDHLWGAELRLFTVCWHWQHYRISSDRQEAYCSKHGFEALTKRINRFRAHFGLKPV